MKPNAANIISAVGTITIDEAGAIRSFDAVSERLFGYPESDVVGKNVAMLMPEPYHSEHNGYLSRFLSEGSPRVIGKGREVIGRRKDGTNFPIWLAVNDVKLGKERVFVGSVVDLSEQKSVEADLARSLETTRAILDTAVNPIITINSLGIVSSFNPASERLFGYTKQEVVGQNVKMLMPEPYRSEHDDYLNRYLQWGEPRVIGKGREVIGKRKDGSTFPMHLSVGEMVVTGERMFVGIIADISKLKAAENDLAASLETTRAILDTAVNPIITIDSSGLVRSFNPSAEKLFGYSSKDALKKNINMLMPEPYRTQHDDYLTRYLREGNPRVIGKGREVEGMRKDGSTFPMHLSVGEMKVAGERMFVGIIADITERKAAELELQRHRDHLEELVSMATAEVTAIIQTAVNGIITINENGLIHIFNPSAEKLFGWRRDEVIGKNVSLLMEEPFASQHNSYLSNFLASRKANIIGIGREVVAKRKDGSTFPAYLAVGHTELSETQHFFVGFISDITPQKKNEAELKQAKEDAEAGAKAKSAFVANMSHEIRTPMNAIIGFSEVALQDPTLSPETYEYVKTILSSAKSLLGIINDILDVSKLESGKLSLEAVCFNLPNALADALHTLEHRAESKGLSLSIEYASTLPIRVMGDPHRLRQVILNLVSNAIKFTEKGSITLSVQQGDKPDMLHFSVKDTGIGMTPEQCAKIFVAFSQADASTTRRFGGTGLGTTISKQIVTLMNGNIWVESEVGQGSIFHFTARLSEAAVTKGCLYEDGGLIEEDYLSPRLFRILLAEDIEANAILAMLRLKQQGHDVSWVKNGREAVDEFRKGGYDLILMDVMMPELDGLGATREIRRIETDRGTGTRISILALTASIMREDSEKCLAAGMDCVEGKPIDFNRLFVAMEKIAPQGVGRANAIRKISINASGDFDFSSLKGIADHKKAIKTWCDPVAYVKALFVFSEQHSNDAQVMERLLSANPDDNEPARAVAHALKGLAGNLAINPIAGLANAIDANLKSGQREAAKSKLCDLRQSLAEAATAIGKLSKPADDLLTTMIMFDADAIRKILVELAAVLDELNPDVAEPVIAKLAAYITKADLASIQMRIEAFDFDDAKAKVFVLAEKLGISIGGNTL